MPSDTVDEGVGVMEPVVVPVLVAVAVRVAVALRVARLEAVANELAATSVLGC
jgi:hypothetical protein